MMTIVKVADSAKLEVILDGKKSYLRITFGPGNTDFIDVKNIASLRKLALLIQKVLDARIPA